MVCVRVIAERKKSNIVLSLKLTSFYGYYELKIFLCALLTETIKEEDKEKNETGNNFDLFISMQSHTTTNYPFFYNK